jgi:hypothetical protein
MRRYGHTLPDPKSAPFESTSRLQSEGNHGIRQSYSILDIDNKYLSRVIQKVLHKMCCETARLHKLRKNPGWIMFCNTARLHSVRKTQSGWCFVTGHDFSRAEKVPKSAGL